MTKTPFIDLVKSYAERPQDVVDWEARKIWWFGAVQNLFEDIKKWLKPLVDQNIVNFKVTEYLRSEEYIGPYTINGLNLHIASQQLKFIPKGTLIVGGYGRIDIEGTNGNAMLILAIPEDKENIKENSIWYISHPLKKSNLIDLTEENFQTLFVDLLGIHN